MTTLNWYQIAIIWLLFFGFVSSVYKNYFPTKAREPYGTTGLVVDFILWPLAIWVYYKAGLFSSFMP